LSAVQGGRIKLYNALSAEVDRRIAAARSRR
jgi:hypothetical protein